MQLKPTVLAYFRVMVAHLVGPHPAAAGLAAGRGERSAAGAPGAGGRLPPETTPVPAHAGRESDERPAPRVGDRRRRHPRHLAGPAPRRGRRHGDRARARRPASAASPATMDFGGHEVDRFYHVMTPADAAHDRDGRGGRARRPAALHAGRRRLLRRRRDARLQRRRRPAALLAADAVARLRLGWFVAQCQLRSSYEQARRPPARELAAPALRPQVVERIWKPLLDSRFDGDPSGLPATYLWARTRRMSAAREGRVGARRSGTSSAATSA